MGNKEFKYTYEAPTEAQRREIASIKRQYEEPIETVGKLERLRKLHAFVNGSAQAISLVFGILGCLVFGLGLTMILEWKLIIWGVVVAIIGFFPMVIAYPINNYVLRRNKAKYGDEIMRLSEELLHESEQEDR